jgi:hypothetical protein
MKLILLVVLAFPIWCFATSLKEFAPIVTQSNDQTHYFINVPEKYHYEKDRKIIDRKASGKAYFIEADGTPKFLWETIGWYSPEVFMCGTGSSLIRITNWHKGNKASKEDLAIAFYINGVEIRKYSTADLLENDKSIEISAGGYQWRADKPRYPGCSYVSPGFFVRTTENRFIEFNFETGEITDKINP